jgi:hypothetical protein
MIIIHYILSFGPPKERIKEKLSGCNKTAKNLLVTASLEKLLTSFVNRGALFFVAATELGEAKQFLRSSLSYGFINAVFCNAGFIYSHPPPKQAKTFRCISGRKASGKEDENFSRLSVFFSCCPSAGFSLISNL